jgi:hypothetical protein
VNEMFKKYSLPFWRHGENSEKPTMVKSEFELEWPLECVSVM